MDNKDLITRFAEDCFRFEALHQEIDSLIADEVNEVLIYEYEDLANQAAEIVLKLSANGNNLGHNFYRYYVERLEYIIDYFRALLDYEETPLAEDEPNELDDATPAETHFEGFPADCAFPKFPDFFSKVGILVAPTAKAEENAAADAANDSEDEQPEELDDEETPLAKDDENAAADETDAAEGNDRENEQPDDENDTQAAANDEAADDIDWDAILSPDEESGTSLRYRGLKKLFPANQALVRDTYEMWREMKELTGRKENDDEMWMAAATLEREDLFFIDFRYDLEFGDEHSILIDEQGIRGAIEDAIDAIPGFRDSEKFKELIEHYPTYKEIEQ